MAKLAGPENEATMKNFVARFGPWAVVTGASSGIGEAFAQRLAATGMNLVLIAQREDRLQKLADDLQSRYAVNLRVVAADLSRDDFLALVERPRMTCRLVY